MKIKIFPLGAGQDVGRSCILLSFGEEKRVLLDVGVHMGYKDKRKYPNFDLLIKKYKKPLNNIIDLVLVTHFHLDHCAALPVLTEHMNYTNPIYTSSPTKAIIPYMLKDFMNVSKDGIYHYSSQNIQKCISKISTIELKETKTINNIKITPYYAGHVLGAVMFLIEYKDIKVIYTGDYNTVADRHLRACQIDKVKPDILITESTYGTVVRDWKKQRELQFMKQIKETFDKGGKVLIPVFALGRAQEFFVLIEDIWQKTGWKYPVYFSSGLSQKVHIFYKFFVDWMNFNIKNKIKKNKNPFDLKYIKKFEKVYSKLNQPMIVLATPGMLHGGTSQQIFKEWCEDARNRIIIPGYCVKGTLGNLVLGGAKKLDIGGKKYQIQMEVSKMSFSAHADNRGIVRLIEHLEPGNVVFVHGEKKRMENLGKFVKQNLKIESFCPKNFEELEIFVDKKIDRLVIYKEDSQDKTMSWEFGDSKSSLSKEQVEELEIMDSCFGGLEREGEEEFYEGAVDDEELKSRDILVRMEGDTLVKVKEYKDDMYFLINK